MGGGAADGLQQVLERLFLETKQKQLVQAEQARLAEDMRQADMGHEIAQGNLGVSEGNLGMRGQELIRQQGRDVVEDQQYADEAPSRAADVAYKGALTGELIRKPQAEIDDRTFTTGRDKTLHGYSLGEIGARGAEQRRTDAAGAKPPQAQSAGEAYTSERSARTKQSVNELIGRVNNWTSGVGSLMSGVPASDARNFAAELATLKANIAFGELTEMRNASKTGGALGQVSNIELQLLESTLGALDQGQSPANLKTQLEKVLGSLDRWEQAKANRDGGVSVAPRGSDPSMGTGGMSKELDYVPGKGFVPRGQ